MISQGRWVVLFLSVLVASCEEPKPAMTGRLTAPVDLEVFRGCPQSYPGCDRTADPQHLLLVVNSLEDDLRVFDVEGRKFFEAPNPLFPLSIPVGHYPRSLAIDPYQEFAFVANGMSEDVSVVDLAPNRLVEVDTDWNSCTSYCGPCDDQGGGEIANAEPRSDRCRAGVSRVPLGSSESLRPEDIVTPRERTGEWEGPWDRQQPLPVYVSLSGSGQVAVLHFTYPGLGPGYAQRMDLVQVLDVGGQLGGLAVTKDGFTLFAADEESDSIVFVRTADLTTGRIPVGGPSRRLALTPDDSVLYVVRLDDGRISLVDVASLTRRLPGEAPLDAVDPEGSGVDLKLPGIPRSVAFVQGVSMGVFGEDGSLRDYTTELLKESELEKIKETNPDFEEHVVKTFAYVSDLNGKVYIVDGENHRMLDKNPFIGPSASEPMLTVGKNPVAREELVACSGKADCAYPQLSEYDKRYDDDQELRRIYNGVFVKPGITRSESFILTWEGLLPGSGTSTSGHFVGWQLGDERLGLDFLTSGVEPGDILEILDSPPTLEFEGDNPCFPGSQDGEADQVRFNFEVAGVDHQILDLVPVDGMDLEACWTEALRYNLRASGAWVVRSSESGLLSRLFMVPWQDPAPDPPAYDNGLIALTVFEPGEGFTVQRDTSWSFSTEDGFSRAVFVPTIPAGVAGQLVAVDLDDDLEAGSPGDDRIFLLFEGSNAMMEFFPGNLEPTNFLIYQ